MDIEEKPILYPVGSRFKTTNYGEVEVIDVISSVNVVVKFINSGNVKSVRAGDLLRGFITDSIEYKIYDKYSVGDIFSTKRYGDLQIKQIINSTNIIVVFLNTGFEKKVSASSILRGTARDDSLMVYLECAVGTIHPTTNYGDIEVVELKSSTSAKVKFLLTGNIVNTRPCEILRGQIRDSSSDKFSPKKLKENRFCVYVHKDSDGVIRYVGEGRELRPYVFTGRNSEWNAIFNNYPPTVEIIASDLSKKDAKALEYDLIIENENTVINKVVYKHHTKHMDFDIFDSYFVYDESSPSFISKKCKDGSIKPVGFKASGYYKVNYNNSSYAAHRIVWLLHNQEIDTDSVVDHIDNDRTNNKISNLRLVSSSENSYNRFYKLPKSGYRNIREEYRDGIIVAYRVVWSVPLHSGRYQKMFSVSKFGGIRQALIAAYNFRETKILEGFISSKVKEGEVPIE